LNQRDEPVLEQTNLIMIGRRGTAPLNDAAARPFGGERPEQAAFRDVPSDTLRFYDELSLGDRIDLGSRTFTEDDIITFAKAFDPQFFHVDPALAKVSIFGGLIASGWHTAAGWMGQMVACRTAAAVASLARGERPARLGPSPGFRQLRWIKPVFAGDTIHYTSAIHEMRPSASRPAWGIVRHYNTGTNQRGELVFSFIGSVFWERRPI
jgi:acyl dehydratase